MKTGVSLAGITPPNRQSNEFLSYDSDCKEALAPVLKEIIAEAVKAGWRRRTVASTLMFLAAREIGENEEGNNQVGP